MGSSAEVNEQYAGYCGACGQRLHGSPTPTHVGAATKPSPASMQADIERLRRQRDAEGDRLDWLMAKLPNHIVMELLGKGGTAAGPAEWRRLIDAAAGSWVRQPE